jgi:hypothetical protein
MKEKGTCLKCSESTYSIPLTTLTGDWETLSSRETVWTETFNGHYEGEYVTTEGPVRGYELEVKFTPRKLHHVFYCDACVREQQDKIRAQYYRFPWEQFFIIPFGIFVVMVLCGSSLVCPPIILVAYGLVKDWFKDNFGNKTSKNDLEVELDPKNIRDFFFMNQHHGSYTNSMSDRYYRKITGYTGPEDITKYRPAFFSIRHGDPVFRASSTNCK